MVMQPRALKAFGSHGLEWRIARSPVHRMNQTRKALVWAALAALAALLTYVSFRGYLTAELLLHYANSFAC